MSTTEKSQDLGLSEIDLQRIATEPIYIANGIVYKSFPRNRETNLQVTVSYYPEAHQYNIVHSRFGPNDAEWRYPEPLSDDFDYLRQFVNSLDSSERKALNLKPQEANKLSQEAKLAYFQVVRRARKELEGRLLELKEIEDNAAERLR